MLWLLLISQLSSLMAEQKDHQGPQPCGGRLKGPHGVIQTPNFPNAFPVPIKCKWIIEHNITNGTISIYFTQQYTTSGLTFTEYMYYDDDNMKFGERRAFTVTDENITRVKWLQVQSPVLVVELALDALEGTQLRALGLLSVYGLNVTYAVRAPAHPLRPAAPVPPAPDDTCSALECRLLGHCYATHDYQKFYCACFEGYTGPDCGVGPLCEISSNMCKNGGLCRQMGPAAVSCICAPGYTGDLCESRIADPECGIRECLEGCIDTTCDCNPKDRDSTSARFETKLQVVGKPNTNLSQAIIEQLTVDLNTSDIALDEKIEILNLDDPDKEGQRLVAVRIWASRRLAGTLRGALARLADGRPSNSELDLVPTGIFTMQPALSLHALTINQRSEVWEGSEYILSCTAYGSPDIIFTWYKDGVKINFNRTTRDIWTRTVAEDALGRRISVLGVSEAQQVDSGRWSCAADDAGRRRCRALHLAVLKPPDIRLLPSAMTVNKGDNVSITCLAGASRVHGALGFSWARERSLLPLVPGREVWEDLFPAGSVLKLYNVQKSGEFRCQVSSTAGTNYKGMMMWTLEESDEACVGGASHGLRWPRTAPGAYATASCSVGYTGETIRFCEPKTAQHGVKWKLPDFSGCISESLKTLYDQFIKISYGYSWENVTSIAKQYSHLLRSLPAHPGEGTIPLQHMKEMLHYLLSNAANPNDKTDSVEHLLKISDTLLKQPDSLLEEGKTFELQTALVQTASMKDYLDFETDEFLAVSKPVHDDKAHFKFEPKSFGNEEWLLMSAGIEFVERTGNITAVVVQYKNLDSRLPSLRLSMENKNGREMEYELTSQQIQLFANGEGVDTALVHTVTLSFAHIYNYSATVSKLACGLRLPSEPEVWSTQLCKVQITEPKHVTCQCQGLGTYALFTASRAKFTEAEKDLQGVIKITAGIGGAACLVVAVLQLLGLLASRNDKMPILLKAATAGTHSASILSLLECDTRQEEACPGTLGWVCVICWCAGCAALCAQPLLLQQELAGRSQNAASIGLLAGVCIMCLLTARIWGGSPLQLGAAAQVVCSSGCALLLILCLGLALCSALRLRSITQKMPLERRNYLKDRSKVIQHTLVLLLTQTAAMVAGVTYAQPGERKPLYLILLAVVAVVNGIAMVVCYVICDDECMLAARRALSLVPTRDWTDSPSGNTSLSLYIKQSREVESRGGAGAYEVSPSRRSPMTAYWRAPTVESPARIPRRRSNPDNRADVVRFVEYTECVALPPKRNGKKTRGVCDLVPCVTAATPLLPPLPPLKPTICPLILPPPETNCVLCTRSTPDVSTPDEQPIKSCLKKSNQEFSSSTSLPSMESVKDESKSQIEQVNNKWNKAYSKDTEKVLSEISTDLDFLLNRSGDCKVGSSQIEKAPT